MNMKPLVYIESSVISYLAARPSNNLVSAARQSITLEWWDIHKSSYELCVSRLVEEEVSSGNAEASERRRSYLRGIAFLEVSNTAIEIAQNLLDQKAVPKRSEEDALHIGIAAAQGVDYLLTWNFKHINNAVMRQKIIKVIESMGFLCPQLCSPEELGGMDND